MSSSSAAPSSASAAASAAAGTASSGSSSSVQSFVPTTSALPTYPVEVKSNATHAYEPASLKDLNHSNSTVLVSYPNQWKADEWVPVGNVRPSPPPFDMSTFNPQPGDLIEAQAKSAPNEPYSWWKATVKTVRGEFYMIKYTAFEQDANEILERDMLRPVNKAPPITINDLKKQTLPLPKELWSSVQVSSFATVHQSSGVFSLTIDENRHELCFIGSADSVKRAQLLSSLAFKHLAEIQKLQQKTASHQQDIATLQTRLKEGQIEEFKCDPALMGLVIGKKGKNIKLAEQEEGVQNVRVDSEKGVITILAKSHEAAVRARRHLEFIEQRFAVPANQIGRIVGRNFQNIRDIEESSGVTRIRIDDEQAARQRQSNAQRRRNLDEDTGLIDLIIVGTKASVEDAILLLQHHMHYLKEVSELSEQEREAAQQLNALTLETGHLDQVRRRMETGSGNGLGGGRPYEQRDQRDRRGERDGRVDRRGPREYNRQYQPTQTIDTNEFPPLARARRQEAEQRERQAKKQQQQPTNAVPAAVPVAHATSAPVSAPVQSPPSSNVSTDAGAGAGQRGGRAQRGGRGPRNAGDAQAQSNNQQKVNNTPANAQPTSQSNAGAAAGTGATGAGAGARQQQQRPRQQQQQQQQKPRDTSNTDAVSSTPLSSPPATSNTPGSADASQAQSQAVRKTQPRYQKKAAKQEAAEFGAPATSPSTTATASTPSTSPPSTAAPSADANKASNTGNGGDKSRRPRRPRQPADDKPKQPIYKPANNNTNNAAPAASSQPSPSPTSS